MDRSEVSKAFGKRGPILLPVIHAKSDKQVIANIVSLLDCGCLGFFLINHDFNYPELLPIMRNARERFPDAWMGVNFLGVHGDIAFPILESLKSHKVRVDAYWADDACIDEKKSLDQQTEADDILRAHNNSKWSGLYFGGTAFKKQREVDPKDFYVSAQLASHYMDVVTTSGSATGVAPDVSKIHVFREACGSSALALASGVTEDNISAYSPLVDIFLVATGINFEGDFYNIEPRRLDRLMKKIL